jgi:hypothetical protein
MSAIKKKKETLSREDKAKLTENLKSLQVFNFLNLNFLNHIFFYNFKLERDVPKSHALYL